MWDYACELRSFSLARANLQKAFYKRACARFIKFTRIDWFIKISFAQVLIEKKKNYIVPSDTYYSHVSDKWNCNKARIEEKTFFQFVCLAIPTSSSVASWPLIWGNNARDYCTAAYCMLHDFVCSSSMMMHLEKIKNKMQPVQSQWTSLLSFELQHLVVYAYKDPVNKRDDHRTVLSKEFQIFFIY